MYTYIYTYMYGASSTEAGVYQTRQIKGAPGTTKMLNEAGQDAQVQTMLCLLMRCASRGQASLA